MINPLVVNLYYMDQEQQESLEALLQQWYDKQLDEAGEQALFLLLEQARSEQALTPALEKVWAQVVDEAFFSAAQQEALFQKILPPKRPKVFLLRKVAAAAVLLLIAGATILYFTRPEIPAVPIAGHKERVPEVSDIKAPEQNRATLTLSDGRQLVLDSAGSGALATEGAVSVRKTEDGELIYSGNAGELKYHTLSVPKGSKPFQLTLPDGSKVKVNVASSITFPTAFSGVSRKVSMTGEAYFEVVHQATTMIKELPFIVEAEGMQLQVMGTRFNVNAYTDEKGAKTTLVEGAVKIVAGDRQQLLVPGQQAFVNAKGAQPHLRLVQNPDVEEAMAWVHGKFRFTDATVETVMRQVARWYDVEVSYAARPNLRFGGQIDRNSSLRQVLTILETSGLHFTIDGKQVIIRP